jgi:hypothetical protein
MISGDGVCKTVDEVRNLIMGAVPRRLTLS